MGANTVNVTELTPLKGGRGANSGNVPALSPLLRLCVAALAKQGRGAGGQKNNLWDGIRVFN